MKKAIALAVCLILIPFTAFSMEMVSDEEMEQVTGQSGVAITIDDLKIYTHNGKEQMWYETGDAAIGTVYEDESYQMMHVNAIVGDGEGNFTETGGGDRDLQGTYDDEWDYNNDGSSFQPSALTITVKDELDTFEDAGVTGVEGVEIGLPTVEVFTEEGSKDVFDINVTTDSNPLDSDTSKDDTFSYGTIHSSAGDSTTAILDGQLEIAPLDAYEHEKP